MLMQRPARLAASVSTRLSFEHAELTPLEIWHGRVLQCLCWVVAAWALGTLALS